MKLIYKGKFDGNPDSLPCRPHEPNAVKFKEFDDIKKFAIFINIIAAVLAFVALGIVFLRCGFAISLIGCILSLLAAFPHELLHALCFKDDVYLYTNLKQGMLFVTGPEIMSKSRMIFMSLLPNIVFGFIPFTLAMIFPQLTVLGTMGALSIGMGAGDYYNVFNAATQVPKGGKLYLYKFNTYWFMPEK